METPNNAFHTKEERLKQLKFNNRKSTIRRLESIAETVAFALLYYLMWILFYKGEMNPYLGKGKFILLGIYIVLLYLIFSLNDAFEFGHLKASEVAASQSISLFFVNFITYFQLCLMANHMLNVLPTIGLLIIELATGVFCVYLFTAIYHQNNVPQNMLLIYGNENAVTLKFKMDTRADKYRVTKVMHINEGRDAILDAMLKHDSVILNDIPAELRNDILKGCYKRGIRTYVVPKVSDIICRGAEDITLFDTPLMLVRGRGFSPMHRLIKRAIDIVLCSIAMVFFIPIYVVVAICIKAEDRGPIFYKQKRITINEKEFNILKFRSMVVDAEKGSYNLNMRATDKDPRITKVGAVIRRIRIDELPQILNILKGDMSIVGPRAERVENHTEYCHLIPEFVYRTKVKAGLTGYAQVYGKYNTSAYDKLRLDMKYIEEGSIFTDIKIIFMTVQVLFRPESTEGFDKAEELEALKRELLDKENEL